MRNWNGSSNSPNLPPVNYAGKVFEARAVLTDRGYSRRVITAGIE